MDAWIKSKLAGTMSVDDLAGLHQDSYEEQQQKQQEQLSSRECCQVGTFQGASCTSISVFKISLQHGRFVLHLSYNLLSDLLKMQNKYGRYLSMC